MYVLKYTVWCKIIDKYIKKSILETNPEVRLTDVFTVNQKRTYRAYISLRAKGLTK